MRPSQSPSESNAATDKNSDGVVRTVNEGIDERQMRSTSLVQQLTHAHHHVPIPATRLRQPYIYGHVAPKPQFRIAASLSPLILTASVDNTGDGVVLTPTVNRLSKVLAKMGVASRREAEEIIAAGRVTVNGAVVTVPQTIVRLKTDKIVIDGKKLKQKETPKYYFYLNKPSGYLSASKGSPDYQKKPKLVMDLLRPFLDKWKNKNPDESILPRLFTEYVVHTTPEAKMKEIRTIGEGCRVDGKTVVPIGVAKDANFLRIVVSEGRNREIRTLVENAGLQVKSLKRVRIGGFRMPSDLKIGAFRRLLPHEKRRVTNLEAQSNG